MSLLFRLCRWAPLLLYLTLVHVWLLPVLFLLYVGGAVGGFVFPATAASAVAAAVVGLLPGRKGAGGLDLLELFHRRGGVCVAAPVLYVASYAALAFVAITSLYLYTTPLIVIEGAPVFPVGNVTEVHVMVMGSMAPGGRFIMVMKGDVFWGSAGWVLYTALWAASFYSALAAALVLAWRPVMRSAELARRAEVFYEKAREILS
ncbi:hypothetical protein [Thermoproteus tenax]|uniref:Uncharacterized protein n=1 Tax=Thermoproteus tenax (strain ATCC 35583 / DSM 2078 / JCM 9277 / NBRC 100435 / Kra 1) TaxID=768679 RepID=G4RLG7_THETK|nr:hypothetical protein [Thermoproteus tenax]CCC82412.1 hypothetical protein TTX_1792 [Thermoproteus tenax Kra 1]